MLSPSKTCLTPFLLTTNIQWSNFKADPNSRAYAACQFQLNGQIVLYRQAKITPKKIGQFVSFWQRQAQGTTAPFSSQHPLSFYLVYVEKDNYKGLFIFPKAILIEKNILSTIQQTGKRGFRVYPNWDQPTNATAKSTQKWQLQYFYALDNPHFPQLLQKLFPKRT